jgi:N-acyl-D-aspartate/D-glutamate deacylase
MLDILIRGGTVVDGSGAPTRPADVGVRAGRIVAIGDVHEDARETIDARDRVVCPGFIDPHTHYDAQVFWDGTLSPSCYHGVTTIFGGNCGFSIAPLTEEAADYLLPMLARVEGMPIESLREGVPWDWESFGDYLGRLDGRIAINAGFMVGHSAVRRAVMGPRAVGEEATPAELEAMKALLAQSLREGGMGFSTGIAPTHNDGDGKPVPSRHASREELVALAGVCRDHPGTTLEFLPGPQAFDDEVRQLMTDLSLAANRPLNWNVLAADAKDVEDVAGRLAASDYARARGGEVIALTMPAPARLRINLATGFVFDAFAGWADVMALPIPERMERLRDPAVRAELDRGANSKESGVLRSFADWNGMLVEEVFEAANERHQGRSIGEISAERGVAPFDAMLDLALSEELQTSFMPVAIGDDDATWAQRGKLWQDDRTLIGASDAGAHLDMLDAFALTSHLLSEGVRRYGLISLEEAIHQITDKPARLFGLRERGRVEEGWIADLVVLDPERVASGPVYTKKDLPAGAGRLYADAIGIDHVIVGGTPIVRHGEHTGAFPGTVIRSGRDTDTVTP